MQTFRGSGRTATTITLSSGSWTEEGVPFCGIGHTRGAEGYQAWFDIYRHADAGKNAPIEPCNLDIWNVIPLESGFWRARGGGDPG